jgi:hypothetical protein
MPLETQTRLNITRWADEYISGLVQNHHGDREDVRAIIHELHELRAMTGHAPKQLHGSSDPLDPGQ